MRQNPRTATTLLCLLAAGACLAMSASGTLAASIPGGVAAPGGAPAPPAPPARHKIHPSGIATWFGPGFYGSRTACGQTLTPTVVGVANRTLPCGTLVLVSYAGHTLTLPVLDRGPYSHIADWDLTSGAAQSLGITETVRIRTRIVGSMPNTPMLGLPALPPGGALAG